MKADFLVSLILIETDNGRNRPHSTYFDSEDDFDYFLLKATKVKWAKLFKQSGELIKSVDNSKED